MKIKQLLQLSALLILTNKGMSQVSFSPVTTYTSIGTDARSVRSADFNSDGRNDIAIAVNNANVVSIFLNSGSGLFSAAVNYAAGSLPVSLCTADFNNDGKSDIATANVSGGGISILLNSGSGTFGAATNYSTGVSPYDIESNDFNGDGLEDLVVVHNNSQYVSVLLGTGTGTFGAPINYTVGTTYTSVSSADFNGDGKADITTSNSGIITVLLGTGTGSFTGPVTWASGSNLHSVCVADFNSDSKVDIAGCDAVTNNVSVLLGTGTGSFAVAVTYSVGSTPVDISSGDLNNDGKVDLMTANANSSNVSVLLGSGTGTFGTATNFAASPGTYAVCNAELNGDGKLDIAATSINANILSILLNTSPVPAAALNVDGVNDYIVVPNNTALQVGAGNFTVEFWAKASQVNGQFHYVVTKDNTNSNMEFLVGLGSNDKWFCNVKGLNYIGSTNFVTPNVWYHVACTYDGVTEALYVNGVLQGTVAVGSAPLTSPADILIGGRTASSPQQFFAGDIDEVRIWNYARTACQISSYMNYEIANSAAGLLANYHFNQGVAGNANAGVTSLTDASSNSNNGTLTNFALSGSTSNWITPGGVVSGSTNTTTPCVTVTPTSSGLNGDGTNDRVAIPHAPSLNVENNFTIECWFNTNIIAYETNLMEKGRWAGNWLFFIKPKSGQGTKICLASWAWGPIELWGTTDLQVGTWYHYAATWDGTTRKVYLNGVLEASDVPTGDPIGNTSALGLGAASGGTYEFNGTIDDARIWNVVRTPAEIAASYSVELSGNEPGLVAYYQFNDGGTAYQNNTSINTVNDLTANNNDGVLTNYAKTGCTSNYICGAPVLGGTCSVPSILTPTLATVSGNCLVNLNSPTTTDACASVTFTGTTSSATTYTTPGTYTVNWLFDDGFGTTANATQTIVVNAPSLPVISISEMPSVALNVAVGGTAAASSNYGTNFPNTAFDNDTITEGWGSSSGGVPAWLEYDFGTGNSKTLVKYAFYCASTMQGGWGSTSYNPSVWTFEGYNGTTWDVLDSRTDNAPVQDVWNVYTFTNTTAYPKYRINISQSPGMSYVMVTELRLYEAPSGPCSNKIFTSSINSFATPANYQWQVNGNNVGSNTSSLSLPFFFINDVVTCDINTANTCVTSSVVTSNQVVLTTGAVLNSVNATICAGETYTTGSNTYTASGTYTINGTAVSGCDSITLVNLTVDLCTSINSLNNIKGLVKVNPNPNNGLFTIELIAASDVTITNAIGQVVLTEQMDAGKHNLDIHNQSTGIYFVKVILDGKQHVIKLIKE